MSQQDSLYESRKRFLEETNIEAENESANKKGIFEKFKEFISNPFGMFETEKKVGEISLQVYEGDSDVTVKVIDKKQSNKPMQQIHLTSKSNYEDEVEAIFSSMKPIFSKYIKTTKVGHITLESKLPTSRKNSIIRTSEIRVGNASRESTLLQPENEKNDSILYTPSKKKLQMIEFN